MHKQPNLRNKSGVYVRNSLSASGLTAQAETITPGSTPTQPGANASSAPSRQAQPEFGCNHGSGGIDIDMNPEPLPQAVVYLNEQPNGGMPTPSLDDELIQRNESR